MSEVLFNDEACTLYKWGGNYSLVGFKNKFYINDVI